MAPATKRSRPKSQAEFQAGTAWYGSTKSAANASPPPDGHRTAPADGWAFTRLTNLAGHHN